MHMHAYICYRFYNYKQQKGQLLVIYIAKLCHLAATCEWTEAQLAENICNKFMMGLQNECLLQQLLSQDHKKALEELLELARTFEAAEHESLKRADNDHGKKESDAGTVAATGKQPRSGKSQNFPKSQRTAKTKGTSLQPASKPCASCGGAHLRSTCRFRNVTCRHCGKIGHIAKVCRSTAAVQGPEQPLDSAVITINKTADSDDRHIPPVFQTIYLPELDKRLRLVIDTASPLTFINTKTWADLHQPKLEATTKVLGAFEGQPIHPIGYFQTTVQHQDDPTISSLLKIYITQRGINLIGRDGQVKLNITIHPEQFVTAVTTPSTTLQEIITMNEALFKPQLGCCTTFKATLTLREDTQPKYCKVRKLPFALKPVVGAELDRLEKQQVLEKVSHSDWATPLVVVRKPGGKVRLCGDFKVTLNPALKNDVYPFPLPEELFQKLNGGHKFSKLDLAEAYLQVPLEEASSELTVINTHQGLYRYKRLPFGLSCAPALFQKLIEQLVGDIPGVACYLDDIVVTGCSEQDHLSHLRLVMEKLNTAGLRLKLEKCHFFQESVTYLGHVLDKAGIHPHPDKIKAITAMPYQV